jgi:hypothetical protein
VSTSTLFKQARLVQLRHSLARAVEALSTAEELLERPFLFRTFFPSSTLTLVRARSRNHRESKEIQRAFQKLA